MGYCAMYAVGAEFVAAFVVRGVKATAFEEGLEGGRSHFGHSEGRSLTSSSSMTFFVSTVLAAPRADDDDLSGIGCCKCFTVTITQMAATNKMTRDLDCMLPSMRDSKSERRLAARRQRKRGE